MIIMILMFEFDVANADDIDDVDDDDVDDIEYDELITSTTANARHWMMYPSWKFMLKLSTNLLEHSPNLHEKISFINNPPGLFTGLFQSDVPGHKSVNRRNVFWEKKFPYSLPQRNLGSTVFQRPHATLMHLRKKVGHLSPTFW